MSEPRSPYEVPMRRVELAGSSSWTASDVRHLRAYVREDGGTMDAELAASLFPDRIVVSLAGELESIGEPDARGIRVLVLRTTRNGWKP